MYRLAILLSIGLLFTATGCNSEVETSDLDIQLIDQTDLINAIDANEAVLVDIRSAEAYRRGHIPRAIHLPLHHMRRNDPRLTDQPMTVVYGQGGDAELVKAGAKKLLRLKYENVHAHLDGVRFWVSSGRSLMKGSDVSGRPDAER